MEDEQLIKIRSAVADWAKHTFRLEEVFIGAAAEDEADDDEAQRFLVDFAVRRLGQWQVAEVWVTADQQILSVNDLGEGLPLDDARWPWPDDQLPG